MQRKKRKDTSILQAERKKGLLFFYLQKFYKETVYLFLQWV